MHDSLSDTQPLEAALPSEPAPIHLDDRLAAALAENAALRADNQRLREIDAAKDAIWTRLGHELRTPLNFVTGFASILGDEIPGQLNTRQQDYVRKILGGADRILRLVDTFVNVAALEAGTFALDRRPTPFAPLVEEVLQTFRPLADHKMIRLVAKVDVPVDPVIDGPRVAMVIANMVANAIHHNPEGGVVRVTATLKHDEVRTVIEDGGPGLHPIDVARILGAESLTPSRGDGAGLGLGVVVCKRLVGAHGGRLGLDTELGGGCRFWFELPLDVPEV